LGKKRQKGKIPGNQRKQVSRLKGPSSKLLKAELHARALLNSGKIEEAIDFLRVKCQRENSAPTLQSILGVLEVQSGLSQIGLERSKNAAERAPNNFEVLINYGTNLLSQGYASDAIHYFKRAIKKNPKPQETYLKLANAYLIGELLDQATLVLRNYNEKHPEDLNGLSLLVETLYRGQKLDEAKGVSLQLIKQDPSREKSHIILLDLLISAGELETAENYIQKLKISQPELYNERIKLTQANIVSMMKSFDSAINFLNEMVVAQPGSQTVAKQWRSLMLAAGYFKKGWQAFSEEPSRLEKIRELPHRVWQGEKSDTRTLLIRGAEGIGEQLMYSQLFPFAQERSKKLVVECDKRLVPIFSRSFSEIEFVSWLTPPDKRVLANDIEIQAVPRDLARFFLQSFQDFPAIKEVLIPSTAGKTLANDLRARYPEELLVGISWRSSSGAGGAGKSIPLTHWKEILKNPKVKFINLQYGSTESEVNQVKKYLGMEIVSVPEVDTTNDIDGCMGLISGLDLVITVSNVTAHYAGNVGIPVWVLVSKSPLWHWFTERSDSPWYQTVKLYRQNSYENWVPVLNNVAEDLSNYQKR